MKQTYVLEVDGKPQMVFREKTDAAAANWIKVPQYGSRAIQVGTAQ